MGSELILAHILVKFNILSLPEGVEILDAYLELHIYSIEHYIMNLSRCLYIQVHRLTEDWNEDEVTWNRCTAMNRAYIISERKTIYRALIQF